MRFVVVLLLTDLSFCNAKRNGVFFYKTPELKFNINFVNVSWDFSVYAKGTMEKPVEIIPEYNMVIMKDQTRIMVS
jgi:hypothetical protein